MEAAAFVELYLDWASVEPLNFTFHIVTFAGSHPPNSNDFPRNHIYRLMVN
ncbi:hypothetical protein QG37_00059 [Candidozyma auris]|nr:hypothetical protein QG37_00059 [[Candida] auris]